MVQNNKLMWAVLISNGCIILLLAVNIFLTVAKNNIQSPNQSMNQPTSEMTRAFGAKERDEIVSKLIDAYNHNKYRDFYNVMGDFAKSRLSYEQVVSDIQNVKNVFGNVNKFTFSNYGYDGEKDGASWIRFIYKANFDKGNGQIRINVRYTDDKWEIVGFKYNLGEVK